MSLLFNYTPVAVQTTKFQIHKKFKAQKTYTAKNQYMVVFVILLRTLSCTINTCTVNMALISNSTPVEVQTTKFKIHRTCKAQKPYMNTKSLCKGSFHTKIRSFVIFRGDKNQQCFCLPLHFVYEYLILNVWT